MNPRYFLTLSSVFLLLAMPPSATASGNGETFPTSRVWQVKFTQPETAPVPLKVEVAVAAQEPAAQARPQAFEYGDFYNTRRKIHMIASYLTIPLAVGETIAGQKLYDGNGSEAAKSAHGAFTAGLAGLFAVNTVTGAWNLWEGRKDLNGRTKRIVHSVLMLAADAGFLAAASLAPDDDDGGGFSADRSAHRNVAIASMSLATASYLYMLVTR